SLWCQRRRVRCYAEIAWLNYLQRSTSKKSATISCEEGAIMQLGMIGLGRMGANMVRRLIKNGHNCVVFDHSPETVGQLVKEKAVGATSLTDLVKKLDAPRVVWLMVPAAVVDDAIKDLLPLLAA